MKLTTIVFRFLRYLQPYWFKLSIIFVFMIVTSISSLLFPYLMKVIIDDVFPQKNFELLIKILIILLSVNIFSIIISFISNYLYTMVSSHVMRDMRQDLFNHLIRLPLSFFQQNKTGDIVHRIHNEVNVIQDAITASVIRFALSIITIIGLSIALCWLNYQLFFISMIVFPFLFLNVNYFQPRIRDIIEKSRIKSAEILGFFVERFENIKLIQSYNRYHYEHGKLSTRISELIDIIMKNVLISSTTGSISSFLISLTPVIIFGWGGRQVMLGTMTIGALVAFLQYLAQLYSPYRDLMSLYMDLLRASVSMKRVFEFMDLPIQSQNNRTGRKVNFVNKIMFKDVQFAYEGNLVLKSLNLEFVKGRKYALVGASGCGKSTIVNLLCQFYEPQAGEVYIDDTPLQDFDLFELRQAIGLVTQDNQLFHDTIWENIRYGNLDSLPGEIEQSAKFVDIYEPVTHFDNGFASQIGDQGTKLSGGEKQRIAIARAILKNADILIMDEATSALDSESEKAIFDNLKKLYADKTMILISHRLSAIKDVDEIICIHDGSVVEKGTYAQLMNAKGFYWKLFHQQTEH